MRAFLSIVSTLFLTACSTPLALVSPETKIESIVVSNSAIRLTKPFTFKPALWTATYPPGIYSPQFEDKDGIFFRAPAQIIAATIAGGSTAEGGIYVSRQSWSQYQAFVDHYGDIYKFDIPFKVEFDVIQSP